MSEFSKEIDGFTFQHNPGRGQQHSPDALPTIPSNYYVSNLILSHNGTNGLPSQSIASSSPSTSMSSGFDRSAPQTSTDAYLTAAQQPQPSVTPTPLVCEFTVLGNCVKAFASGDETGWITHIAKDHLNYKFPPVAICWFCDREFRASSHGQADTEACYRERMHHIAKHLRNGLPGSQIHLDVFLLKHLSKHGLINGDMAQRAQVHQKAPISSLYPTGWKSEDRDGMSYLMEDNKSSLANAAARSDQRSQPLPAVSDCITPPVVYRSYSTRKRKSPIKCDECKRSFDRMFNLKRHIRRFHLKTDAFPSFSQDNDFMVSDGQYDTALFSFAQY